MPPLLQRQIDPHHPPPPPDPSPSPSPPPSLEEPAEPRPPRQPEAEASSQGFLDSLFADETSTDAAPLPTTHVEDEAKVADPTPTRSTLVETYAPAFETETATQWYDPAPTATATTTATAARPYRDPPPTDDRTMRETYSLFKQNCVTDPSWDDCESVARQYPGFTVGTFRVTRAVSFPAIFLCWPHER